MIQVLLFFVKNDHYPLWLTFFYFCVAIYNFSPNKNQSTLKLWRSWIGCLWIIDPWFTPLWHKNEILYVSTKMTMEFRKNEQFRFCLKLQCLVKCRHSCLKNSSRLKIKFDVSSFLESRTRRLKVWNLLFSKQAIFK